MRVGNGSINYEIYENGDNFCGTAEVQLPELSQATTEVSGAGIAGKYTMPYIGQMEAMNLTISFKTVTEQASNLATPENHYIDIRVAQQTLDATTGKYIIEKVKYLMTVTPVKNGDGKVAPSSPTDGAMDFSVSYFAQYIDGKKMKEFDLFNFIYYIGGKDHLAEVRKAMGKE